MKIFKIIILIYLALLLLVILLKPKQVYSVDKQCFSMWGNRYCVREIESYKLEVYYEQQIPYYTFLKLATINQLECGREDGFCDSGADVGPFQINQIHGNNFTHSKKLINQEQTYMLFVYQMFWTYNRMLAKEDQFCNKYTTDEKKAYCQFRLHNANTRKSCNGRAWAYCYADKGIEYRKILMEMYPKDEYEKKLAKWRIRNEQ